MKRVVPTAGALDGVQPRLSGRPYAQKTMIEDKDTE